MSPPPSANPAPHAPSDWRGRRVLVTGGTGFIGRRVVNHLLEAGADVTCVQRRPERAPAVAPEHQAHLRYVRGDVSRDGGISAAGHDSVIHLAAWVSLGLPAKRRGIMNETNVEGTRRVLDAARKADVEAFVHVSSIAAFGATPEGVVADESFDRGGVTWSAYEESKTGAHRLAEAFGREHDLPVALAMPGVVLGARGDWDPLLAAVRHGRLPALPTGDKGMSYVHVEDTADAIVRMLGRSGPYLVVDVHATVAELVEEIARRVGAKPPRLRVPIRLLHWGATGVGFAYHAFGRTAPVSREVTANLLVPMRYSGEKAKRDLGWSPDLYGRLETELTAQRPS